MINGLNINGLVGQLKADAQGKRDFVSDTSLMTFVGWNKWSRLSFATNKSQEEFEVSRLCGQQIASKIGIPTKYWDRMQSEAPSLLETNVNHWFKNNPEKRMIRTMGGNARAFLSNRYRALDNDAIAAKLLPKVIDAGYEVRSSEITEQRMYIQLITPKIQGEVKKGDIVQGGIIISNSEVGCGSLKVEPLIYRLVCTNGMIASQAMTRRHLGKVVLDGEHGAAEIFSDETRMLEDKTFWSQVNDLVGQVTSQELFEKILAKMQESTTVNLKTPTMAVEIIQKRYNFSDSETEDVLNNLIRERDNSVWGLANSVTACANTCESYDRAIELEKIGGMIIEMPASSFNNYERGITIKMAAVKLDYVAKNGQEYELNLIDTPGHVDFTYEVSRALMACEGALLVVDASQGVEAQTIANAGMAMNHNLEIVPVINKIDLPHADVERAREEIEMAVAIDASDAIPCSAKSGIGIDDVLEAIVHRIPHPVGKAGGPLRALIYDSHFDSYQGAIAYCRVKDGAVKKGDRIKMMSTGSTFDVDSVGVFRPALEVCDSLGTGEVGFITAAMKAIGDAQVGDTVTSADHSATEPLPGYRKALSMVFCGLYPTDGDQYEDLRDAIDKLKLNDAALDFAPETSAALGFGFRCGFLGLLHMEIARERLEREFNLDLILTAPSVDYLVNLKTGEKIHCSNPSLFPDANEIASIDEPIVSATIMVPNEYVGAVMTLCQERRGTYKKTEYPTPQRVIIHYVLPLGEILLDFFDKLKSSTRGYASLDYDVAGYQNADLVKLDIMLNGDIVDALSFIVHKQFSYNRGRAMVEQLRKVVPRQQYEVRVQAAIGAKVISADTIKPFRKNVIAKCYGGDITRKRKLLEKQKEGKKRMKQIGTIELPQEAFLSVLKVAE